MLERVPRRVVTLIGAPRPRNNPRKGPGRPFFHCPRMNTDARRTGRVPCTYLGDAERQNGHQQQAHFLLLLPPFVYPIFYLFIERCAAKYCSTPHPRRGTHTMASEPPNFEKLSKTPIVKVNPPSTIYETVDVALSHSTLHAKTTLQQLTHATPQLLVPPDPTVRAPTWCRRCP